MPQSLVDLPFEKIVATVKKLSEEEQEKLLFAINKRHSVKCETRPGKNIGKARAFLLRV